MLFNHLVGLGKQRRGYVKAERLGGPEVDHKLQLRRLLHRQVGRVGALEDFVHVGGARRNRSGKLAP
jgi:hypothetical protein